MKFKDIFTLYKFIFVCDQTSKNLPDAFENYTFVKRKTNITVGQEVSKCTIKINY